MDNQVSQQLSSILASADYQQKVTQVKEAVAECTANTQAVTDLSYGQAREIAYYDSLSHKLSRLTFMPILSLVAGSTSGKSQVMAVQTHYACAPKWINADEMSAVVLRNELATCSLGTALLEEADRVPERLLRLRPYRVSGELKVNRPHESASGDVAYFPQQLNLFGATVLHRRLEFRDNAVRRRSLIVRWRHLRPEEIDEQGLALKKAEDLSYTKSMSPIADVPLPSLEGFSNSLKGLGSEVLDLWEGLLQVAVLCGDIDWLNDYALPAMKAEGDEIEETMDIEPSALAVRVLLTRLADGRNPGIPDRLRPVALVDISKSLHNDYRRYLGEKQIASLYKAVGLQLKNSGGRTKVYPTRESLKRAGKIAGVRDEMLDSIDEWEEWGYGQKAKL